MRSEEELDDALELLHFAFRQVVLEPDRILAEQGLARMHHRVLFMCRRTEDLAVGELQAILGVSKQALHRPLKDLIERELVASRPDTKDRRVSRLSLTEKGRRFEARVSGAQRKAFARAFRRWTGSSPTDYRRGGNNAAPQRPSGAAYKPPDNVG